AGRAVAGAPRAGVPRLLPRPGGRRVRLPGRPALRRALPRPRSPPGDGTGAAAVRLGRLLRLRGADERDAARLAPVDASPLGARRRPEAPGRRRAAEGDAALHGRPPRLDAALPQLALDAAAELACAPLWAA